MAYLDPARGFSYNHGVDPAVLPILSCPRCRADVPFKDLRTPRCRACGLEPVASANLLDLIDNTAGEAPTVTTEQRLMESELVARMYDRFWRPTFVRLLAGKGAGASVGGRKAWRQRPWPE